MVARPPIASVVARERRPSGALLALYVADLNRCERVSGDKLARLFGARPRTVWLWIKGEATPTKRSLRSAIHAHARGQDPACVLDGADRLQRAFRDQALLVEDLRARISCIPGPWPGGAREIAKMAASAYGVTLRQLRSRKRTAHLVDARRLVAVLCDANGIGQAAIARVIARSQAAVSRLLEEPAL